MSPPWLARRDTDWWIERLYGFAAELGASLVHTAVSRSVIDMNRDPSGASLYPGQATTELCPSTTFDGEPLYRAGRAPEASEIAARRDAYFEPYHRAIEEEIAPPAGPPSGDRACTTVTRSARASRGCSPARCRTSTSAPSTARAARPPSPRRSRPPALRREYTRVTNGRFKGGYTTRHYGRPQAGVHAVQMELACRGYLREPLGEVHEGNWPCAWDEAVRGAGARHPRTRAGELPQSSPPQRPLSAGAAAAAAPPARCRGLPRCAARWRTGRTRHR